MKNKRYLITTSPAKESIGISSKESSNSQYPYTQICLLRKYTDHYEQKGWDIDIYVEIGLGVRLQNKMSKKVTNIIKLSDFSLTCVFFLSIILVGLISCLLYVVGLHPILILIFSLVGLLTLLKFLNNKWYGMVNKLKYGWGMEDLSPIYDIFKSKGWEETGKSDFDCLLPDKSYSIERFREDLDTVCGNGEFCVVDKTTGHVMDYRNAEILNQIYTDCIYKNQYFYD